MRIAIVGGGISGLSLAYYLRKAHPLAKIDLYEKEERLGGVIDSITEEVFFFEKGPRTFLTKKSCELLTLMGELGLEDQIIYADNKANTRYIWTGDTKLKVPTTLFEAIRSPLTKGMFKSLITEWSRPTICEDESIEQFFNRRIGCSLTESLIRPMVYGIYGADISELSIKHTFSKLKDFEINNGSLTAGLLTQKRKKRPMGSLFTVKLGLTHFIHKLSKKSDARIYLNESIDKISQNESFVKVETSLQQEEYDYLFSTLDKSIKKTSITVWNVGYKSGVTLPDAFGILVKNPTNLLGIVFDSKIFPTQNRSREETRLTVMTKNSAVLIEDRLERLLGIKKKPDFLVVKEYNNALFRPQVGHKKEKKRDRRIHYFSSNTHSKVSVPDIVKEAKKYVETLVL